MLQAATVASGTLGLLGRLQAEPLLCSTRLVGGTALSLQIGHRVSDDLDLFSVAPLDGMAVQRITGLFPSSTPANVLRILWILRFSLCISLITI